MFNNQCDLGLSNIPGPTKKIVFGEDMTVESIIPVALVQGLCRISL